MRFGRLLWLCGVVVSWLLQFHACRSSALVIFEVQSDGGVGGLISCVSLRSSEAVVVKLGSKGKHGP